MRARLEVPTPAGPVSLAAAGPDRGSAAVLPAPPAVRRAAMGWRLCACIMLPAVVSVRLSCWLCCVAVGCGLCPCRCDRLASCPVRCGLSPAGCGLWRSVCLACWLEALPPVLRRCWWMLSACALLGGYRGRIYQAPRILYRAHKTPSGAAGRLTGGLFSPSLRRGSVCRRRPATIGRHHLPSAGPPVGGPLVLLSTLASCLSVCWSCPPPTDRPTENAGENAPDFPGPSAEPFPPVQLQCVSRLRRCPPRWMPQKCKFRRREGIYAHGILSRNWF